MSIINTPLFNLKPNGAEKTFTIPFSNLFLITPFQVFFEIDIDSSCARPPIMVIIISSVSFAVSMFFFLKEHGYSKAFKLPYIFQAILCVSCKTADRFGIYPIYLTSAAILYHSLKLVALVLTSTCYSLIGIDIDKLFSVRLFKSLFIVSCLVP